MSVEHLPTSGASVSDISRLWDICRRRGKIVEGARGQGRLWGNIFWIVMTFMTFTLMAVTIMTVTLINS